MSDHCSPRGDGEQWITLMSRAPPRSPGCVGPGVTAVIKKGSHNRQGSALTISHDGRRCSGAQRKGSVPREVDHVVEFRRFLRLDSCCHFPTAYVRTLTSAGPSTTELRSYREGDLSRQQPGGMKLADDSGKELRVHEGDRPCNACLMWTRCTRMRRLSTWRWRHHPGRYRLGLLDPDGPVGPPLQHGGAEEHPVDSAQGAGHARSTAVDGNQRCAAQCFKMCRWLQLIHEHRLAPLDNAPFSTPWARQRYRVAQHFRQY
jgi:hypothetical protein